MVVVVEATVDTEVSGAKCPLMSACLSSQSGQTCLSHWIPALGKVPP